jgi:hypothetical protein
MANPHRGELDVLVEGTSYTWRLPMNMLCTLEARSGQRLLELLKALDEFSPQALRHVVWAAMQEYHADECRTVEAAGDFIDRLGGMLVAFAKVRELLDVNQPPSAANPQTPTGTGEGSTLRAVG